MDSKPPAEAPIPTMGNGSFFDPCLNVRVVFDLGGPTRCRAIGSYFGITGILLQALRLPPDQG